MAIVQNVWRFQCDPPPGDYDPPVEVFTKDTTEVDGVKFENLNMVPVVMKLSELVAAIATEQAGATVESKRPKMEPKPVPRPSAPPLSGERTFLSQPSGNASSI